MNYSLCLITGCTFLDAEQRRWVHGDLHQLADTLIFNANGCEWQDCETNPLDPESMCVRAPIFYEKNSQLVFPLGLAEFNVPANEYLGKTMRGQEKQIIIFGH